jgi:uncharacterized protein YbjT (DUF2867 family)
LNAFQQPAEGNPKLFCSAMERNNEDSNGRASGKYAHHVVPVLKALGAKVKALVTNQDKQQEAIAQGADETAIGNLQDEQSLIRAAQGVGGVFHLNPAFAPNEAELGIAMVSASVSAGVKKFTFSGVIHPSLSKMRNHSGKRPVEEALYESGLTFTVLQPTMFMQTIAEGWKEVTERSYVRIAVSQHQAGELCGLP